MPPKNRTNKERLLKQSSTDFASVENKKNPGFTISEESLEKLLEQVEQKEQEVVQNLLTGVLTTSLGFNGGVQKFLDIISNQLQLQGIEFSGERYGQILELLTDIKVLTALLKLSLPEGLCPQELDKFESNLSCKAVTKFLNLNNSLSPQEDHRERSSEDLSGILLAFMKDFSAEVSNNTSSIRNQNAQFLRELKKSLLDNRRK